MPRGYRMTGARDNASTALGDEARPLDTAGLKKRESEDVTEEDLLRALLSSSPDAIYFKDLESRFLRASAAMAVLFNCHSVEDLIGRGDRDFFAGEHAEQALADEQEIIRTGKA